MNKKFLLAFACLLWACCTLLCGCNITPELIAPEQIVLDQFSTQVKMSKSVTATILVKDANGMEVSSGTVVMDFTSKQRTVSLKTPNTDFSAGTAWKTQQETTAFDADTVTFGWQTKDFSSFDYDAQGSCCNGVIDADVVKQLGLADIVSSAQGDVNVTLLVSGDIASDVNVNDVVISYRSVNDNIVTITLTI